MHWLLRAPSCQWLREAFNGGAIAQTHALAQPSQPANAPELPFWLLSRHGAIAGTGRPFKVGPLLLQEMYPEQLQHGIVSLVGC